MKLKLKKQKKKKIKKLKIYKKMLKNYKIKFN